MKGVGSKMEDNTTYLAHYGVKGMRWGVRRYQNYDGSLIGAKQRKKAAKKQYNKDFRSAYNFSSRHPITQYVKKSKNYSESNKRWDKATDSAKKYAKASVDYKTAKKEAKGDGFHLSDKQKKAIKIGAIAVGTALVAYGTYKVAKNISYKRGMQFVRQYATTSSTHFSDGTKDFTKSLHSVRRNGSELVRNKTYRKLPNGAGNMLQVDYHEVARPSVRNSQSAHTVADTMRKYGKISNATYFRGLGSNNNQIVQIKDGKRVVYRLLKDHKGRYV